MTKHSSEETTGEGWRRRHLEQPKLEAVCDWLYSNQKRREKNRRKRHGRNRERNEIRHRRIKKGRGTREMDSCKVTCHNLEHGHNKYFPRQLFYKT